MIIECADGRRAVDIGKDEIWNSVYSTVFVKLASFLPEVPFGFSFLKSGKCKAENALVTARQINMIRDKLSLVAPQDAVYDYNNPSLKAPWYDNISPVITSCANLYTTAEGGDLLFELVSLLCYADIKKEDVYPQR